MYEMPTHVDVDVKHTHLLVPSLDGIFSRNKLIPDFYNTIVEVLMGGPTKF